MNATSMIDRPGGRIAYEAAGAGPLVICVPGMGDLRSSYRYLVPALVEAGFRVASADLRGHGDSDPTFTEYGDEATAGDIAALIEELGAPAVILGNSMAAGSAVLVAARRPGLVAGLVLLGPFVRNPPTNALARLLLGLLLRVAMAAPLAPRVWGAYLPSLYAGRKPDDFDEYRAAVRASMSRQGFARAFSKTTRTSHEAAEQSLGGVHTPTLVIMGEADPDFPDPQAEADWIADRLGGTAMLVPEAGHYPQSQRPDLVIPAVTDFLERATHRA